MVREGIPGSVPLTDLVHLPPRGRVPPSRSRACAMLRSFHGSLSIALLGVILPSQRVNARSDSIGFIPRLNLIKFGRAFWGGLSPQRHQDAPM